MQKRRPDGFESWIMYGTKSKVTKTRYQKVDIELNPNENDAKQRNLSMYYIRMRVISVW